MIIDLPDNFIWKDKSGEKTAYIENGILKMRADIPFKILMKELTYIKSR